MDNLFIIVLVLLISMIFSKLSQLVHLPPVIGQLLSGVIFGPAVLHLLSPTNFIATLANMGVIILMFIAGVESYLELLKKYLKPSLIVAIIGVMVPVLSTLYLGFIFHLNFYHSLFLSIIFVSTSVSISVEILKEMRVLNTSEGITILGAAVFDDVIGVMLLGFVSGIVGARQSNFLDNHFIILLGSQFLYFICIFLLTKWGIPWLFNQLSWFKSQSDLAVGALIICFLFSYLAELINLSSITGAFFAGLAIGQTKGRRSISQHLEILGYDFLIPFFFINVGLEMNLHGVIHNLNLFLALSILSILNKLLGAGLGGYISGFSLPGSFMIGAGMISRGEVALIIAQMGLEQHLIDTSVYSTAISAIIVTTLISPLILRKGIILTTKIKKGKDYN